MKKWGLIVGGLLIASSASAGEIGHYAAGSFGPRDFLSPERGTATAALGMVYYKADKIQGGKTGLPAIDVNLDLPQAFAILSYSPKTDVLGANYSFMVMPSYGRTNISAYLSGSRTGLEEQRTGWGDLYVVPANLTWEINNFWSVSGQWGVWAPIGSYDKDRAINNGLGYWSNDVRLTVSLFPWGDPDLLLSGSLLYEFNTKKQGTHIIPGDRLVAEFGASYIVNKNLIVGGLLTSNFEITPTTGYDKIDNGQDHVYSGGLEVIVPIDQFSLTFRALKEWDAKDRTDGDFFYMILGYQF